MSLPTPLLQLLSQPVPAATKALSPQSDNKDQTDRADKDALETAKKFEALLIHTMLKNMRAASTENPLLNSDQLDLYNDMFDQQIAQDIASNGKFGIADVIYRQLTGRKNTSANTEQSKIRNLSATDINRQTISNINFPDQELAPVTESGSTAPNKDIPQSQLFIEKLQTRAANTARKLGTTPEAVIAIAALETGWGIRIPLNPDGSSSNNLFGIKADSNWTGQRSIALTSEFKNGRHDTELAAFRSYPTENQSVDDFANFINRNPRYRNALSNAANAEKFITELQRAGYATDPDYAEKAIAVLQQVKMHLD